MKARDRLHRKKKNKLDIENYYYLRRISFTHFPTTSRISHVGNFGRCCCFPRQFWAVRCGNYICKNYTDAKEQMKMMKAMRENFVFVDVLIRLRWSFARVFFFVVKISFHFLIPLFTIEIVHRMRARRFLTFSAFLMRIFSSEMSQSFRQVIDLSRSSHTNIAGKAG